MMQVVVQIFLVLNFLGDVLEDPFRILMRNKMAEINGDLIQVTIPFDLHALDCGAPDCYVNEISFVLEKTRLKPPSTLSISEREYGCDVIEKTVSHDFGLVDFNQNFVSYYSADCDCGLVIISNDPRQEFVYFFDDLNSRQIIKSNLNTIFASFESEDGNVPFRSTMAIKRN